MLIKTTYSNTIMLLWVSRLIFAFHCFQKIKFLFQEARKLSIQRCIQSLVHACQCRDANCRLPSCQKMKRVVQHTKICKRKANGDCPICKQLIALCCYHAKYCQVQFIGTYYKGYCHIYLSVGIDFVPWVERNIKTI